MKFILNSVKIYFLKNKKQYKTLLNITFIQSRIVGRRGKGAYASGVNFKKITKNFIGIEYQSEYQYTIYNV